MMSCATRTARLSGNVAAVWREQRDLGHAAMPLRTLQAVFARELRPAERASAKRGEAGRREHGLYLRYEAPHRNAVWQADHKQLPILVVAAEGRRGSVRRPWVTLFLDDYSRAIMGWAISLQPSSAEVLAGGVFAIAPELRRFIATHQQQQPGAADGPPRPFLGGTTRGRMSQPSIRRALAELDAP